MREKKRMCSTWSLARCWFWIMIVEKQKYRLFFVVGPHHKHTFRAQLKVHLGPPFCLRQLLTQLCFKTSDTPPHTHIKNTNHTSVFLLTLHESLLLPHFFKPFHPLPPLVQKLGDHWQQHINESRCVPSLIKNTFHPSPTQPTLFPCLSYTWWQMLPSIFNSKRLLWCEPLPLPGGSCATKWVAGVANFERSNRQAFFSPNNQFI